MHGGKSLTVEDLGENNDDTQRIDNKESDNESEHIDHITNREQSASSNSDSDKPRSAGPSYVVKDNKMQVINASFPP
ncbi:hypothetical protein PR048_012750 [Dryococelus australis]|uniref:Uncharacterized protein n=1 Tax=Dryococelus australis TaxID=614101 RepID=A0ABQ9HR13_9NEOP|nr:hypothetical protein PR048_012750 [Dryococelus australis]